MRRIIFIIAYYLTTMYVSAYPLVVDKVSFIGEDSLDISVSEINNIVFYFSFDNPDFDPTYMSNMSSLEELDKSLNSESLRLSIDTLFVSATASPEGNYNYNLKLAEGRALSFKSMLIKRYNFPASSVIELDAYVTSWSELGGLIEEDSNLPMRDAVLKILNSNYSHGVTGWKLKKLGGGESWRYIRSNYLPYLRNNDFNIDIKVKTPAVDSVLEVEEIIEIEPEIVEEVDMVVEQEAILPLPTVADSEVKRKPLFALKTNLLFDALTLINLELEVPIGNRWSVAGEWIFPWWTFDNGRSDSKRNRIQMLNGNLEGRYWFGDRLDRPQMTGWFAGVYVGGGLYDFEYKAKGYQGEFFIMGGLSGGYAHTINKAGSLRMEYSLGIGYIETNYAYYESCFNIEDMWHAIRKEDGRYSYLGPTRAKVSLVWMINRKLKRGGVL